MAKGLITGLHPEWSLFDSGTDVNVPLRKGNLDLSFPKKPINLKANIRFCRDEVIYGAPKPQFENQRAVSKVREKDLWFRVFENSCMLMGNFEQCFPNQFYIGPVSDTHGNDAAQPQVLETPIGHLFTNELGIGDNKGGIVKGLDLCRSDIDLGDGSPCPIDLDYIADLNRPFKKENEPLTKLLKMFCSPNPSPTPSAPNATVSDVVLKPRAVRETRIPTTQRT